MQRVLKGSLGVILALTLMGCPSLPLNQSASTVPAGTFVQGAAVEYIGVHVEDPTGENDDFVGFLDIPLPGYWFRYGVSDMIDLGVRYSFPVALSFDAKIQLVDSEIFDLSIMPTLQFAWVPFYVHLPVLLGINLSDNFEVVLSPRFSYMGIAQENTDGTVDFGDAQPLVGGGLSFIMRFGNVEISPEFQFLQGFGVDLPMRMLSVSVGVAYLRDHSEAAAVVVEPAPVAVPVGYEEPVAPPPGGVQVEVN